MIRVLFFCMVVGVLSGCHAAESSPLTVAAGTSCHGDDADHICLGVKYVVYKDSSGQPVATQDTAVSNLKTINQIWGTCNVGFEINQFITANPSDYGLQYSTANTTELDDIRNAFQVDNALLVVTTGPWNRAGTLGSTKANAWTAMPGGAPFGTILEKPVGDFANIIAHELGHYLNLYHVSDPTDLLNPVIYSQSTNLNDGQCSTARSAIAANWPKMLR